ncbi:MULTISPECIES: transporter substrate-binding domain-containing protein [Marivita]|uniref:Transporter substrate-binding domain-containing protein n=1 Tax=Marivita cryptomonadis TaxID=505252 RepID=A0A9Q2P932_9RHOB|nr:MULTISPECIES: transporter substrate-binding domain-containing protein [Marivita]MCR9167251.1 transporter substrate-binding domain-containing protein [Paracoccaceae bacterium]MBM2320564.1 transporter substrate-binding domain-containing protein [Marivita cryptomonadis]MBM2330144.1 transporter substrate-binding domain-containing protein [Marivita cryptomonadis]MBM2339731.1 transporter substrate-binding domain-containing protein [Marivita cryptomonadis]MBM2344390.1 transporter substrate-binding
MNITRRFLGAALGATLAATAALPALAQNTAQDVASASVIETIKERGVIKIGLSLFKPWSMRDLNGELIGFELDVGRQLAEDMGVEVEFVPTSWDGIIPALVSGNFDTIISGMTVTPQRNLTVNFTVPYAYSGMTILANTAMTEGFTLEDYNSSEVTFAARRGATPATVIADMFPEATLLLFDEDGAATQEVLNGNAHATMASEPTPSSEARRYPDVLSVPFNQAFQAGGEGFAIRKGDPDALAYFNSWITAKTNTGWLKERHDYWFRGNDWADQVPE